MNVKITYIYQSGFILELKKSIIIIDYYKADNETLEYLYKTISDTLKNVYVCVSHSHHDHFNKDIFDWVKLNSKIKFILSSEIDRKYIEQYKTATIIFLDKFLSFQDNEMFVKAYGSTDIGSSFYIESEGLKIFHAGDLNNWHWNEEFSDMESKDAENLYLQELSFIAKGIKDIDILFFPLDPRLGADYMLGAIQFISQIKTSVLIPMHFGDKYLVNDALLIPAIRRIDKEIKFISIDKEGYKIKLENKL